MKRFTLNKKITALLAAMLFTVPAFTQLTSQSGKPRPIDLDAYKDKIVMQAHNASAQDANRAILLQEDFSLFTAGSEDAPDTENVVTDVYGGNYFLNPELTNRPGWIGHFVYQAGGMAYLGDALNAFIDTPEMLIQGTIHLSFKARIRSGQQNMTVVGLCRNTTDPQPYDMAGFYMTSEWTQYDFDLNMPVADTVFIQINGFTTWYLDDLVISIGTEDVAEDTETNITVYPNPANDMAYFGSEVEEVTVYDMKGAQVFNQHHTDKVDTSALPNGTYLFYIRKAEGITAKQIIINH